MDTLELYEKLHSFENIDDKYAFATEELINVIKEQVKNSDMPQHRKDWLLETIELTSNLYSDSYTKLGIIELLVNTISDVIQNGENLMAKSAVLAFHEIVKYHSDRLETTVNTLTYLIKSQEDELKNLREENKLLKGIEG